nr:ketopantoate reductase C-terminal domain-containing protein [Saprospiraceae bacterium]
FPLLLPAINKDTIVLPLLNGVDSKDKIKNILPDNLVLDGCVYIVSRLIQDGIIENSGNIQKLFFGLNNLEDDRLFFFEDLFKRAGIDATLSQNISTIIWEKFIFLSPIATSTSYFDTCIGDIISDSEKLGKLKTLIEEVKRLAIAKHIHLDDDINEKTLQKLKALPYYATSSMHSDFKKNKAYTELKSLTAYVIDEGRKYNVETPIFRNMYLFLRAKR